MGVTIIVEKEISRIRKKLENLESQVLLNKSSINSIITVTIKIPKKHIHS
jgi:hypothetical protein